MEETPEEVLARLQRYADSVKGRGAVALTAPANVPRGIDTAVVKADAPRPHTFGILSRTLAGQLICVATCIVTIVLWIHVSHAVAYIVVPGAAVFLGIGLTRRFPFAGWALIGLLLGLALGALS